MDNTKTAQISAFESMMQVMHGVQNLPDNVLADVFSHLQEIKVYFGDAISQKQGKLNDVKRDEAKLLFDCDVNNKDKTVTFRNEKNLVAGVIAYFKYRIDNTTIKGTGLLEKSIRKAGLNSDIVKSICQEIGKVNNFSQEKPTVTQQKPENGEDLQTKREKRKANQLPDAVPVPDAEPNTQQTKQLIPISVFDCEAIEPKKYILDGLIEAETITLYSGQEKIGKTYSLMNLAMSMSAHLPWLGLKTMQDTDGGILWLNLDMSRSLGKRRVNEIMFGLMETSKTFDLKAFEKFSMMDAQSFRDAECQPLEFFSDTNAITALREYIIATETKVCFIDNLIQIEGGADENRSGDMRLVLNRVKELRDITGCSFILIHHTDKAGNRGRGSSDIFAETDINLQLEPDTNNSELLLLNTDGARNTAKKKIGMMQKWCQRLDNAGNLVFDGNNHAVWNYFLYEADADAITTAKNNRTRVKTDKKFADYENTVLDILDGDFIGKSKTEIWKTSHRNKNDIFDAIERLTEKERLILDNGKYKIRTE